MIIYRNDAKQKTQETSKDLLMKQPTKKPEQQKIKKKKRAPKNKWNKMGIL